jgi:3-phosphoshikimate 1-carboxyvinyltransferase
MPLPPLIEIVPLSGPVHAEITVPGSKSITNRALILAALAEGRTTLRGALWSEDTQVMAECLERLGFEVMIEPDPDELGNRTITVQGLGGAIPKGGSPAQPLELFVGNAGTAARFLTAFVCLGKGVYRLQGVPRMHERPQAALFEALRQLGYTIESANDRLPAIIHGEGPKPGPCFVDTTESSQFASALLLSAKAGGWEVQLVGDSAEEGPDLFAPIKPPNIAVRSTESWRAGHGYAALTWKLMEAFPKKGGVFQIEPDASSGSYFWAAGHRLYADYPEKNPTRRQKAFLVWDSCVQVLHWPESKWQIDERFPELFERFQLESPHTFLDYKQWALANPGSATIKLLGPPRKLFAESAADGTPPQVRTISRRTDLGDSIMTAIVMAPLAILPTRFTDLGRLRVQECERVVALRTELMKCGARVVEEGDTLTVYPAGSELHGAEIETYHDHRMAMCFAILGLKVPGIKIKNPACVKKTFPNFFQKLALAPPNGLGAAILDTSTGRRLEVDELFAG